MTKINKSHSIFFLWCSRPPPHFLSPPDNLNHQIFRTSSVSRAPTSGCGRQKSLQSILKRFFSSKFLMLSRSLTRQRTPAQIADRWRYRPPIKNLTAHQNSPVSVSFHFCLYQEAQRRLQTFQNGPQLVHHIFK